MGAGAVAGEDSESPSYTSAAFTRSGSYDEDDEDIPERDPEPHEIAQDAESRCKYSSKFCIRKRTIKRGGKLHKFCEFHRQKANRNQRRLENRKRIRKALAMAEMGKQRPMPASFPTWSMGAATGPFDPLASNMCIVQPGLFHQSAGLDSAVLQFPMVHFQSPREVEANVEWEPLVEPAALFPEDLEAIHDQAKDDDQHPCDEMPRAASVEITSVAIRYDQPLHHHC